MMHRKTKENQNTGHRIVAVGFLLITIWIIARLFILQIIKHDYYVTMATKSHETTKQITPERGNIYFTDARTHETFPAAINKTYYLIFATPKTIPASEVVSTTNKLSEILGFDENAKSELLNKLSDLNSSYKIIAKKVPENLTKKIQLLKINSIGAEEQTYRYYPEDYLAANVLGFVSRNDLGDLEGKYGIEGFYNKKLTGRVGYLEGEKGAGGGWIALAERTNIKPEDGSDLYLTIDRAVQKYACDRLREGMKEYKAKSASLVLLDPNTGAVLAMCSLPDFDPNNFSEVDNLAAFNNTTVFSPYEPGSVFKAFTMGAGLDLGLVTPNTTFVDACELTIDGHKVRNAEHKCYGRQTMTQVLENSINTGVVWVEEKVGGKRFYEYIKKFGFGEKTGISLSQEMSGDISSLTKKGDIYGANGSFGQGLTATPLQIATGFAAIANGGKLMRPFIIAEERTGKGQIIKTSPEVVEISISESASALLRGMLVSVVDNHYRSAQISNYYVAGKTGTAQIPEKGKYSEERTNHTFAGFAPATKPAFTLVVKYEEPERKWAEQTSLPIFRDVLKFVLEYYGIPGDKK